MVDDFKATQEMRKAAESIIQNLDVFVGISLAKAKMVRAYYLQLIQEEFTEYQALELCKSFKMPGES
jgi:hypothetical protein